MSVSLFEINFRFILALLLHSEFLFRQKEKLCDEAEQLKSRFLKGANQKYEKDRVEEAERVFQSQ